MLFLEDIPKYISERQLISKYLFDNFLKQSKASYTTLSWSKLSLLSSSSNIAFTTHKVLFCNYRAGEIELFFQCFECFKCFYSSASNESLLPLNSLERIDGSILSQNYSETSRIYFFGETNFNFSSNTIFLNATIIKYLTETAIFEDSF